MFFASNGQAASILTTVAITEKWRWEFGAVIIYCRASLSFFWKPFLCELDLAGDVSSLVLFGCLKPEQNHTEV